MTKPYDRHLHWNIWSCRPHADSCFWWRMTMQREKNKGALIEQQLSCWNSFLDYVLLQYICTLLNLLMFNILPFGEKKNKTFFFLKYQKKNPKASTFFRIYKFLKNLLLHRAQFSTYLCIIALLFENEILPNSHVAPTSSYCKSGKFL